MKKTDSVDYCPKWENVCIVRTKKFLKHLAGCQRCQRAEKKEKEFWKEMSKCASGTCGHGHAGDPPGSVGGSDF